MVRPSGRRWWAVLSARVSGSRSVGLEVGEPIGLAAVADRVEVAVGAGLDGADARQVVVVVVGAELGLRLGAEMLSDTVGGAVGTSDTVGDGVGGVLRDVSVFSVGGGVGFGVDDESGDEVKIGWWR